VVLKYNINPEDLERFLDGILHGDEEHRDWLTEATYNFFVHDKPIPTPRGSGTKDRLYKEIENLRAQLKKYEQGL
jgi:hypothetical protein